MTACRPKPDDAPAPEQSWCVVMRGCAYVRRPAEADDPSEADYRYPEEAPLLAAGVRTIYRSCDGSDVPFTLWFNGTCCPGAQPAGPPGNGSLCRCERGAEYSVKPE